MHDVQIIENTNSNVETNEKMKMNSGVKIKHARYRKGQSSSDTPLNSKEGASSASQGAVIARPVTGHDQDLHQHDNQIVEYANSKVEKTGRKKRKGDSEKDALILQCFNEGLTTYQTEKKIIEAKDTNFTSLSTIKRRFKELDALILQCFNDGMTAIQAEKIIEAKGKNISLLAIERRFKELEELILKCFNDGLTAIQAEKKINVTKSTECILLSTIIRRYDELEKLNVDKSKSPANLLNSEEKGTLSASQADKATTVLEGENEAQVVEATGSDLS
uniref:Uncharacterized protein n=1 Tax=Meloidogyne enterolobii TaxID=390850 RepID=A0A6V7V6K5_MELEN|nr:unnamed protein product [Meloidogyne enterolobii]